MPEEDKSKYTDKQKQQAHIEEGYEKRSVSEDKAEKSAPATVNKQGSNRSGSGHKNFGSNSSSEKDAPDRDSSATKGDAGTRPPSDS